MGFLRLGRHALWLVVLMAGASTCLAQQATEAGVKAAFLYKFAGYVEWPAQAFPGPDTPLVIAVAGSEEVAAELDRLVPGRTFNDRRVVVRRVKEPEAARGAHVLFVGRGEPATRAFLRVAQQAGALAVTENEHGLDWGSAINFVVADDRVGFEVSLESAERSGLRISSRMLAVARRVVPRT